MKTRLLILVASILGFHLFGQETRQVIPELQTMISEYSGLSKPQKLFIHFDKENYYAGENIWFKVYLLDAVTHKPDTSSSNLWVELVNSQGEIIDSRLFKPRDGLAWGDFDLSDSLSDGNYYIRAFTNSMLNLNPGFHFVKYFYIRNPGYADMISRADVRFNRRFNKLFDRGKEQVNVVFFPEGGNLVSGLKNRVAFRVTDELGNGLNIKGELRDSKGKIIAPEVESKFAGMGYFSFTPVHGENYTFFVENGRRRNSYNLPAPMESGYILSIDSGTDTFHISVKTNVLPGSMFYSDKVFVVAHTRGVVFYGEELSVIEGRAESKISSRKFPSGITHFTLFLPDYRAIAERLVFLDHKDQLIFSTTILDEPEDKKNLLTVLFNSLNPETGPAEGSFSVSIQNVTDEASARSENIVSYLLLSSDLGDFIENPGELSGLNDSMESYLDLIMLTHGWRRFAWDKVVSGIMPVSEYSDAYGITLSGVVINPANNKPVVNHRVQLRIMSGYNHIYHRTTNNEGAFVFSDLKYNDIIRIEITADRLAGGVLPFVRINSKDRSGIPYQKNLHTKPQQITDFGKNWRKPERRVFPLENGAGSQPESMFGTPDQTVYLDERLINYRSLLDVLKERVTGLTVVQGQVRLRGTSSFYGNTQPLFYMDGTQVDARSFFLTNPNDVHRIEVFKGASSAIFGARGANGAILGFTKRYANIGNTEFYDFLIRGYHTPREFYNDKISTSGITTSVNPVQTIFWKPDLLTNASGKAGYFLPLMQGVMNYRIIIQGVGKNGGFGFGEYIIRIVDE